MASHLYWTDTHCHLDMLEEKIVSKPVADSLNKDFFDPQQLLN